MGAILVALSAPVNVRAQCGPSNITVTVGGQANYTIPTSPVASNAVVSTGPNTAIATVNPTSVNNAVNPMFFIRGIAPGTTGMIIQWVPAGPNPPPPTTCNVLINVTCPTITLSPATLPGGTVGTPYNQTITASGGTSPYSFAVTSGALPNGLALSSGGLISGIPTVAGSFNFTIRATDAGSCNGSQSYTLTITRNCPTITLSPTILPGGTLGTAYNQSITANGGISPYSFAVTSGAPPGGLTLSTGGLLSGIPTSAGSFNFTVRATDANSCAGIQSYPLTINCSAIRLNDFLGTNMVVGVDINRFGGGSDSARVEAAGGAGPYTFEVTGSLPDGLTTMSFLDNTLIFAGVPTKAGIYQFTVTATDKNGCKNSKTFTVTVGQAPLQTGGSLYSSAFSSGDGNSAANSDDPVLTPTGEYIHGIVDLQLGGPLPLAFGRHYGGLVGASAEFSGFYGASDSPAGANWVHNFLILLRRIDANNVSVYYYQGKVIYFRKSGSAWSMVQPGIAYRGTLYQLIEVGTKLKMMDPDSQVVYSFDTSGLGNVSVRGVETISDRNGNTHTLAYNSDGTVAKVSDGLGRSSEFAYVSSGGKPRISKVTDQTGRFIQFDYSGARLTGYTDARGKATAYATNTSSLVESITHPGGNTPVRNTYNSGSAKVASQADGLGNTTRFAYNADNTVITDALGNNRTHFFNQELRFVSYKDEAGKTIQFGYDNSQRNTSTLDRMGDTNTISYDATSGKVNARTDNTGKTWKYTYSAQTQDGFTFYDMTRIDYPDATHDDFNYDTKGNLVGQTDRAGKSWAYTYNSRGQPLTATNPDGGVVTYTYNADGTPASLQDPAGNTTAFGYDALKRLNKLTRPDNTIVQYSYDASDNVLTHVNEKGKTTTYSYDDNSNLTTVTNPLGKSWTFAYDANENLIGITDPLGKTTTFAYDPLRRIKSVTDRNGSVTTYNYNASRRLASVVNAAGKTWSFTYDDEGIPTSVSNPLGRVWQFTSDKQGRTTGVADPLLNQTRFNYDALSRLISQTNPLSETTSYAYDPRGLISQTSQPGPITAAYTRNNLGLITQITDPRGKTRSQTYDKLGRMLSSTDPLGNITRLSYDQRNRPSRIDFPGSASLNFTYDELGFPASLSYSDGTRLVFSRDDNNRLTSASGITLGYDDNGRLISTNGITLTRDSGGRIATMTMAPGKTVNYGYDSRDLLTSVSDWIGETTRFSRDDAGRLVTVTRPNGVITTYSYDNANRLTGITEARGQTALSSIALVKDGKGQTKQVTRDVPLPAPVGTQNPNQAYNDADQIVDYTYDALGRLTGDGARTYSWDLASRLTSYNDGQSTITFTYDAFGDRLARTTEPRPSGSGQGATRNFVWNYALGIPSISIVKEAGNTIRYYIHTPGGALLYSMEETGNARRFYHYDEIGSTLFLTDDSGSITDTYAYAPYGQLTASSGSSDNPFTYAGEYGVIAEPSTGLYYMRARYYDSATGKFLSRDPVGGILSDPKSLNPYEYAAQDPLKYLDPFGTDWETWYREHEVELYRLPDPPPNRSPDTMGPNGETYGPYYASRPPGAGPEWAVVTTALTADQLNRRDNGTAVRSGAAASIVTLQEVMMLQADTTLAETTVTWIDLQPSFAFDTTIFTSYAGGLNSISSTGSGTATFDLYIFDPSSQRAGLTRNLRLENRIRIHDFGGVFGAPVKLGFGIIVVGGTDPNGVNLQGFVVNSHTGAFDVSVFGFEPQAIKANAAP